MQHKAGLLFPRLENFWDGKDLHNRMKSPMALDHQLENPGGIFTVMIPENDFCLYLQSELGPKKCDFWYDRLSREALNRVG